MFRFVGITGKPRRGCAISPAKEGSMAVRDVMRASAAQFVEPGETIEQVFGAQTASPLTAPLIGSLIALIINRYRIVAVTDRRILVLDAGKWTQRTGRAVATEPPRGPRRALLVAGRGKVHPAAAPRWGQGAAARDPARPDLRPLVQDRHPGWQDPRPPLLLQGRQRGRHRDRAQPGLTVG